MLTHAMIAATQLVVTQHPDLPLARGFLTAGFLRRTTAAGFSSLPRGVVIVMRRELYQSAAFFSPVFQRAIERQRVPFPQKNPHTVILTT